MPSPKATWLDVAIVSESRKVGPDVEFQCYSDYSVLWSLVASLSHLAVGRSQWESQSRDGNPALAKGPQRRGWVIELPNDSAAVWSRHRFRGGIDPALFVRARYLYSFSLCPWQSQGLLGRTQKKQLAAWKRAKLGVGCIRVQRLHAKKCQSFRQIPKIPKHCGQACGSK